MDKKVIKLGLFLMLVAALAALTLASINGITRPVIEANEREAMDRAMAQVFPDADRFEDVFEDSRGTLPDEVTGLSLAHAGGAPAGAVYTVETNGYAGTIRLMVAFDIDRRVITGLRILAHNETPGLGANAKTEWFNNRYLEKDATGDLLVVKTETSDPNEVQAITAATITSKAVTAGVNTARSHFQDQF